MDRHLIATCSYIDVSYIIFDEIRQQFKAFPLNI